MAGIRALAVHPGQKFVNLALPFPNVVELLSISAKANRKNRKPASEGEELAEQKDKEIAFEKRRARARSIGYVKPAPR